MGNSAAGRKGTDQPSHRTQLRGQKADLQPGLGGRHLTVLARRSQWIRNAAASRLVAAGGNQAVRLMDKRGGWSITNPGLDDFVYADCRVIYVYVRALRFHRAVAQRQAIEGV